MTGRQTPQIHIVEVTPCLLSLRTEVEKVAQPFVAGDRAIGEIEGQRYGRVGCRAPHLGVGTVAKSAVPVIAFHWPVSGLVATSPLASCAKTSSFIEP